MTMARDTLSRTQTVILATIDAAVPTLVQAREIVDAFHTLIRRKQEAALDGWLETAAARPPATHRIVGKSWGKLSVKSG